MRADHTVKRINFEGWGFCGILYHPWNFNHENFQIFYWRNYNGIYLVKWRFRGLFSYHPQNYAHKRFLLSNPRKFPPAKLIHYMVTGNFERLNFKIPVFENNVWLSRKWKSLKTFVNNNYLLYCTSRNIGEHNIWWFTQKTLLAGF